MSCPRYRSTQSFEFREDGFGRRSPREGMATTVVALDEEADVGDEISNASEGATADCLLRDDVEPDLDLVEPRRVSRREVDVEARSCSEPSSHLVVFVGRVVVDDQMHVELLGDSLVDATQELQELLMAMALFAVRHDAPRRNIQGREQRGRTVPNVVMRNAFDVTEAEGEQRLGSIECLDLAFLVDTQHHGVIRGLRYRPTMSRTFSTKKGSVEILKCFWRCG